MTTTDEPTNDWHEIERFSPDAAAFPVRGRMNGKPILVFQTKTGFRGTELACPHLKASLQDAILMANTTVLRCAQHNFTFKLSDGKGINSPSYRLQVYEIKVEGGVGYGRAVQPAQ